MEEILTASEVFAKLGGLGFSAVVGMGSAWWIARNYVAAVEKQQEEIGKTLADSIARQRILEDRQFGELAEISREAHLIARDYSAIIKSYPIGCLRGSQSPACQEALEKRDDHSAAAIVATVRKSAKRPSTKS